MCATLLIATAKAQLRIVTYNTATSGENFSPNTPRAAVETVLEGIGAEIVNGIDRPIDVLLLQEQASVSVTTQAIADLLNEIHNTESYKRGRLNGGTNGGGRAGIVYNSQTVDLRGERAFGQLSVSAQARQTLRYQLRPVGYDEDSDFYAYVNHYKSGTSATDMRRRDAEAEALRANADTLGDGVHAIFAGDFNITTCTEDMFETLTGPGTAQAVDPMADFASGCRWKDNNAFRELHTQSPADSSATGLIQGGVDDRFDFQLVTANLFDGEGLSLLPESYHAFGNNGTHRMNGPINGSSNTALPRTLLNALADASDHLPVVADYQLPAVMDVILPEIPERVLMGSELSAHVTINNAAPVAYAKGADELDYVLDFGGSGFPVLRRSGEILVGSPEVFQFPLPTTVSGVFPFGLNVRSESPQAMNPFFSSSNAYEVVAPAVESFTLDSQTLVDSVSLVVPPDSSYEIPIDVYNLAEEGAAGLDLDTATWDVGSLFALESDPFTNLGSGESTSLAISFTGADRGNITDQLSLQVSDDDSVFGARTRELVIAFSIQVAIPGDSNLDNTVGFDDFLNLSGNFGRMGTEWEEGDFNGDRQTDFADFLLLSGNFGQDGLVHAVPEPSSNSFIGVVLGAVIGHFRRRRRRHSQLSCLGWR